MPITASIFCVFVEIIIHVAKQTICWYGKNRIVSVKFKGVNVTVITCSHAMCASVICKTICTQQLEVCLGKKWLFHRQLHGRHHLLRAKHIFKQQKIADLKNLHAKMVHGARCAVAWQLT